MGTHRHLNITYLDDLGNPLFQAHGAVPLLVDRNHPEVVSVKVTGVENKGTSTSGSFYVQALRQGRALVRLTLQNNPHRTEFVLIRVGSYISPRNPVLHVGSLHDAPCVDTTHGSNGCILTYAILRLIWDPRITVTDSLNNLSYTLITNYTDTLLININPYLH